MEVTLYVEKDRKTFDDSKSGNGQNVKKYSVEDCSKIT